jgi:hypothetical protein
MRQFAQEIGRQTPAAGADLQYVEGTQFRRDFRHLPGETGGEQAAQFRGGHEIPGSAQLVQAGRVIAEAGFVERAAHVPRKRDIAVAADLLANARREGLAQLLELVRGFGQDGARHG